MLKTKGIHHISSIVGNAQRNVEFYTGVLGLRFVKKTLNYDDQNHYHLYYGNKNGSNGIVTTFPMINSVTGRIGAGQVAYVSYAMNLDSFAFWKHRFDYFGFKYKEYKRFKLRRLRFIDPDGLELEFIESKVSNNNSWSFNGVEKKDSFKGIHNAALHSKSPSDTLDFLTELLGYEIIDEDDDYYQLKINNTMGGVIEVAKEVHGRGQIAVGTVHHIAFSINNDEINQWRNILIEKGYHPTEIEDRNYFKSIYFREPGGILIELATEGPGLLIDESLEHLGEEFIIPKHFENNRHKIIEMMMPLEVKKIDKLDFKDDSFEEGNL